MYQLHNKGPMMTDFAGLTPTLRSPFSKDSIDALRLLRTPSLLTAQEIVAYLRRVKKEIAHATKAPHSTTAGS